MDATHLHLLITHLPIFGSLLGAIVLLQGIITKSNGVKIAAYNIFIISAIGAGIAYLTGEPAEETVEHLAGINEAGIEEHEESGLFTLISMIVLGLISIIGLFVSWKKYALTRTLSIIVLIVSLASFGISVRTGLLGGQIRHTEISSGTSTGQEGEKTVEGETEDD